MSKASNHIIVFLALAATLAVALFGFSIMSEPGHMMAGCLGTTPGSNCSALGPIVHFQLHINAFQGISTAIAKSFATAAGATLLLIAAFYLDLKRRQGDGHIESAKKSIFIDADFDLASSRAPFARWLTLHEKRDPSFSFAVSR